jgi:hypothetical protein
MNIYSTNAWGSTEVPIPVLGLAIFKNNQQLETAIYHYKHTQKNRLMNGSSTRS